MFKVHGLLPFLFNTFKVFDRAELGVEFMFEIKREQSLQFQDTKGSP